MVAGKNLSQFTSCLLIISFISVYLKTTVVNRAIWRHLLVSLAKRVDNFSLNIRLSVQKKTLFHSGRGLGVSNESNFCCQEPQWGLNFRHRASSV